MKKADETQPGKRYEKPELREYGDLRQLTETNFGMMAALDGSTYAMALLKTAG